MFFTFRIFYSLSSYVDLQIIELPTHPYYVGVQFHPEFKSRPGKPSALFLGKCLTPRLLRINLLLFRNKIPIYDVVASNNLFIVWDDKWEK